VSIIEQAAKRLEQLRQSGVEISTGTTDRGSADAVPASAAESVPQRIAKELEARAAAAAQAEAAMEPAPPMPEAAVQGRVVASAVVGASAAAVAATRQSRPANRVEIDLARLSANGYITPHAPRSRLAEEFRVIKRPLLINARGKSAAPVANANRIMVSSSLPGEGKTYVSVNLAISLAMEVDTDVLLIDADASRPAVLERLGLAPTKGLLDLLVEPDLPPSAVVLATNVEGLSILPVGTPQAQSTELLASEAMSRLVERLATEDPRRILLFDTPPLLAASESRVLAGHMGQVIMVIAADDTPQGTVAEALATVENCPVVVTLLNRVSMSDGGHYYGSYGAHAH
jgi:receptor protein-tyrosine kinase